MRESCYNLIEIEVPASQTLESSQLAAQTTASSQSRNTHFKNLALFFIGPNSVLKGSVMQTETVEKNAIIEDAVIVQAKARLEEGKGALGFLETRLAKVQELAVGGNGTPRPTFIAEIGQRKIEIELKQAFIAGLEESLKNAISDQPRRTAALKLCQERESRAAAVREKIVDRERETNALREQERALLQQAAEARGEANTTLKDLKRRQDEILAAKEKEKQERKLYLEGSLRSLGRILEKAIAEKNMTERISEIRLEIEQTEKALAELENPADA